MRIIHHTDEGHGWLAVRRSQLQRLGIADRITSYSYQRGGMVYLEEDVDAGAFLAALLKTDTLTPEDLERAGVKIETRHHAGRSWIRGCRHYSPGALA